MSRHPTHIYEFGPFRLDTAERLLQCQGEIISLQPKIFDLLLILVQHYGHLLEKDELMHSLWPDAAVEEANLANNISILRKTLGESSQGRSYIETVPKRGYRFIAPVRELQAEPAKLQRSVSRALSQKIEKGYQTARKLSGGPKNLTPELEIQAQLGQPLSLEPLSEIKRHRRGGLLVCAVLVVAVAGLALRWYKFITQNQSQSALPASKLVHFTSFLGNELRPAFSPDGNQIAFAWNSEKGDNFDIYVKLIGAETPPLRLTTNLADDIAPAWSPDGRNIAFARHSENERSIFTVPALGGPERKLSSTGKSGRSPFGLGYGPSWSPDGKWLAFSKNILGTAIFLLSVETLETRQLTEPGGTYQDYNPVFSPDGKVLAFIRGTSGRNVAEIYLVPVSGGEYKHLVSVNGWISSLAWTPDGRELVFSTGMVGIGDLWRISVSGGTPEPLAIGEEAAFAPTVSRQGNRLAYTRWLLDFNIWQIEAAGLTGRRSPPTRLIASTRWDEAPQFSPDGKRIAFSSWRSGSSEIWLCDSEGLNPVQLTAFGPAGSPRWSPDGQHIAFSSGAEDSEDIYITSVEGGQPRRVTVEASNEHRPSWSRDGGFVYFCSNRTRDWQVWKVPAEGGESVQVTRRGGCEAYESADGQFIYYTKFVGIPGLWRTPISGGEENLVIDQAVMGHWALTDQGIYFVNPKASPRPIIEFFSFATGKRRPIIRLEKELNWNASGMAVSPDGRRILLEYIDQRESDIMLMENFR